MSADHFQKRQINPLVMLLTVIFQLCKNWTAWG